MKKGLLLTISVLLALIPNLAMAKISRTPKKVARIELGTKDSQVGVFWVDENEPNPEGLSNEGVGGMAVDGDGNIYLNDYVNGKIKKFSPSGKFLVATAGVLENIQSFAVDLKGNIFVHNDSWGSRISKFDPAGNLVWSRSRGEMLSQALLEKAGKDFKVEISRDLGAWMTVGPGDNVIIQLNGRDPTTKKARSFGLELDQAGKAIKILPGFRPAAGGLWLGYETFRKDEEPPSSIEAVLYKPDGAVARRVALGSKAELARQYAGVRFGLSTMLPDPKGGFITVSHALSSKPTSDLPYIASGVEVVLNWYAPNGTFVEQLRLPTSPVSRAIASNIAVAPDGSIYHLQFDKTGIDVFAYRPAKAK